MANEDKPYVLNVIAKLAHVKDHLTEECNTDQIVKRRDSATLPKSYRLCVHCGNKS